MVAARRVDAGRTVFGSQGMMINGVIVLAWFARLSFWAGEW